MTRKQLKLDLHAHFSPIAAKFGIQTTEIASDPAVAMSRVMAAKSGGLLVLSYEGQDRESDESANGGMVATRFAFWLSRGGADLSAPGTSSGTTLDDICEELEHEVQFYKVPNNAEMLCVEFAFYDSTRIVTATDGTPLACYKIAFHIKQGLQ